LNLCKCKYGEASVAYFKEYKKSKNPNKLSHSISKFLFED